HKHKCCKSKCCKERCHKHKCCKDRCQKHKCCKSKCCKTKCCKHHCHHACGCKPACGCGHASVETTGAAQNVLAPTAETTSNDETSLLNSGRALFPIEQ